MNRCPVARRRGRSPSSSGHSARRWGRPPSAARPAGGPGLLDACSGLDASSHGSGDGQGRWACASSGGGGHGGAPDGGTAGSRGGARGRPWRRGPAGRGRSRAGARGGEVVRTADSARRRGRPSSTSPPPDALRRRGSHPAAALPPAGPTDAAPITEGPARARSVHSARRRGRPPSTSPPPDARRRRGSHAAAALPPAGPTDAAPITEFLPPAPTPSEVACRREIWLGKRLVDDVLQAGRLLPPSSGHTTGLSTAPRAPSNVSDHMPPVDWASIGNASSSDDEPTCPHGAAGFLSPPPYSWTPLPPLHSSAAECSTSSTASVPDGPSSTVHVLPSPPLLAPIDLTPDGFCLYSFCACS